MRSATPKVLHHVCGRPMILWPVLAALEAGAGKVVVVDNPRGALAGVLPAGVESVIQPEPNGTGGAVQAAADHIDAGAPVLILMGDVPLISAEAIAEVVDAHEKSGTLATMVTAVLEDPGSLGRVVRHADGSVEKVVEAKGGDATPEDLRIKEINTGIYAFDGGALKEALPRLTPDNAQGELYLPGVLPHLAPVHAHVIDDGDVLRGVNDRADLATITRIAQARIHEAHMRNGVTIIDPASTTIDADVTIGQDTTIQPGSALREGTTVGAGAAIGPHTTLIDCTLGDGVTVIHSYANQATLDDGVTAGPFAYLRPQAHLHPKAKAGTFVEIKNSEIGEGAKVPHLSYIGDADVGPRSNLGAGTITANYDGTNKHRTTIGADVRGGVDVALVAPVTVGDGAVTAAGSTITEDVPEKALGIARERQKNIPDYADRKGPEKA
jgi:bifunctional UDP-N-acetylglucosamine pyrophosphorylase/glucosamine-1-phosphate N-acetyltransferase